MRYEYEVPVTVRIPLPVYEITEGYLRLELSILIRNVFLWWLKNSIDFSTHLSVMECLKMEAPKSLHWGCKS